MPESDHPPQWGWLHAGLEPLPDPALVVEPGTALVLLANAAARRLRLANLDPAGEIYATDADRVPIPPERWPHRRAARGELLDAVPFTWHSPGSRSEFLVSSAAIPLVPGRPAPILLSYHDVTRLRATEAEMREAVRVRDEFFSFASHELKDPLATLLLSVEVLARVAEKQGTVPVELLRRRLEVCKRQGERLARMIENLLDTSRIAHGPLQVHREALDLRDVVVEVVGRYRDQAGEAGVALEVEPSGPVEGDFDRVQLEHAVGNLVANALKYGAGRPVTVRLGGDEATARIEVEDRGIGIAEVDRSRIFERFERAADGHRETSLGLGLPIVRSIVEAHGGSVGLKSEVGLGTTFVVALPRRRVPDEPSKSAGGAV